MSRLVLNLNGGEYDQYGYSLIESRLWSGNVIEGMAVTQASSPAMSVLVNPGSAFIPTGTYPTSYAYQAVIDTSGGESVTIATANTSNPRIDVIVAYIDTTVTPNTSPLNNSNRVLKLYDVTGTPASSPSAPSGANIQTAIGAGNPYIILAQVAVGANVTTIVNSNISDERTFAQPNSSVIIPNNQLSKPYKFSAYLTAATNFTNAAWGLTTFNDEEYDTSSNYSTSTGKFTAPVGGFYDFAACLSHNNAGNYLIGIALYKNGSAVKQGDITTSPNASVNVSVKNLQLAAGDYIQVYNTTSTASLAITANQSQAYFMGSLESLT